MLRINCLDCVRKHIAQASVLMDEAAMGYPHHKWYAVGNLAEAESESRNDYPEFANKIRECRLKIMGIEPNPETCFDDLILEACKLAGEPIKFHPLNSKQFKKEE